MSNYLETLFQTFPAAEFVERYLHQLPIAVPAGAREWSSLASLEVLDAIALHPNSRVERSRRGAWWPDDARPTPEELRTSLTEGWTIFVRHAERCFPPLGELASEFGRAFQAPIDVHFFCTPPATEGFGWHYDIEDVFILQTHGTKKYRLRKNTVNPWPLNETTPQDLCYEAERTLTMECSLNAGDWLYIPPGYWHSTHAEELSISLSVGVMSATAIDLLNLVRPSLADSLRWRQRLPLTSELAAMSDAEARDRLRTIFGDLAKDLASQLTSEELLDRYLTWRAEQGDSDVARR